MAQVGLRSCRAFLSLALKCGQSRQQLEFAGTIYVVFPSMCSIRRYASTTKLTELGYMDQLKIADNSYECGQLFIHRIFGYRGIVLFPWFTKLYAFDAKKPEDRKDGDSEGLTDDREIPTEDESLQSCHMYQVLIDQRDWEHVEEHMDIQAVADLAAFGNLISPNVTEPRLVSLTGSDYVMHEDVIPYTSLEDPPMHHNCFTKFLEKQESDQTYIPQKALKTWKQRVLPKLETSSIYQETTEGVRVTVAPFYIGCKEGAQEMEYLWRYIVRLENFSDDVVQLRERFWRIFTLSGTLNTVRGRGVVGKEPILTKSIPAFQYCSHVTLPTPMGDMWGTLKMERRNGSTFDCKIPAFKLSSRSDDIDLTDT